MNLAPIILFVYNRPEHTRKTIDALIRNELASESILYVFSDGPKCNADTDSLARIQCVRDIIHSISGFKKVIITEQTTNVGLDTSVVNGVNLVLAKHGRCITIEDDIVTYSWFLRFINECLDKYENDKRIWLIGGYNDRIKKPWYYKKDVYIAHRCCSWGWGIWKDRWDSIDWSMSGYDKFIQNKKLIRKFCRGGKDMFPMLVEQMKQDVPAWDIRFDYTLMKKNGYVLRPINTLVINNGLDGTGVHCGVQDSKAVAADFPKGHCYDIKLPSIIHQDLFLQRRFYLFHSNKLPIFRKIYKSVRHHLHIIKVFLGKRLRNL